MIFKVIEPCGKKSTVISETPLTIGSIVINHGYKTKIVKLNFISRKAGMHYYEGQIMTDEVVNIKGATDEQNLKITKAKKYLKTIKLPDGKTLKDVTKFEIKKGKIKTKRDQYKKNNWSKLKGKI